MAVLLKYFPPSAAGALPQFVLSMVGAGPPASYSSSMVSWYQNGRLLMDPAPWSAVSHLTMQGVPVGETFVVVAPGMQSNTVTVPVTPPHPQPHPKPAPAPPGPKPLSELCGGMFRQARCNAQGTLFINPTADPIPKQFRQRSLQELEQTLTAAHYCSAADAAEAVQDLNNLCPT